MATVIRTMVIDDASTLRGLLDAVRDALGPTCADATHEALPGLVAEVVACDAAMHCEVDARGEQIVALKEARESIRSDIAYVGASCDREIRLDGVWLRASRLADPSHAAEVAYLEARRGALLAEVDRLHALDRDAGVVIEDLRKMLAEANAAVATARADGAREMRERAAKACEAVMDAQPRSSLGDVAMCCRADVLSLPLPGEEVARG